MSLNAIKHTQHFCNGFHSTPTIITVLQHKCSDITEMICTVVRLDWLVEVFQGSGQVFGVKLAGVVQLICNLLSENLHLTNLQQTQAFDITFVKLLHSTMRRVIVFSLVIWEKNMAITVPSWWPPGMGPRFSEFWPQQWHTLCWH